MIKKIDHVGIVVKNIDETLQILSNAFGFEVINSTNDTQGEFKTVVISTGDASLELIQPLNASGGIARFLEQRGGGMHIYPSRLKTSIRFYNPWKGKV
jgi:methylmalonyl-CoA/ethylmalonyl-CoA epimerase